MCIRDRAGRCPRVYHGDRQPGLPRLAFHRVERRLHHPVVCLLYTSDAADERSSVDLGGRRIIKKKHDDIDEDLCYR